MICVFGPMLACWIMSAAMASGFVLTWRCTLDVSQAALADSLEATADYSQAVKALQNLAADIRCQTIEHFSERMFDVLEQLYGSIPIQLRLCKCHPPIPGFVGTVSVERWRRKPS